MQLALGPDDLDQLIVGVGPGPFTGLRVGVVTAQILSAVLDLPLRGVCSLDVVGRAVCRSNPGEFVVATDARRREVYWAATPLPAYGSAMPRVSRPGDVPRLPTIGPAADLYADQLDAVPGPRSLDPRRTCDARSDASRGRSPSLCICAIPMQGR